MDDIKGGSLYNKILENGKLTEQQAATISAYFVSIIKYMHKNEIIVRNMRPETIYFEEKNSLDIKLIDLCLALPKDEMIEGDEDPMYKSY